MAKKQSAELKGKQLTIRLTKSAYGWISKRANDEKRSLAYIIEQLIQKDLLDGGEASKEVCGS
jgi:hypothetical protein